MKNHIGIICVIFTLLVSNFSFVSSEGENEGSISGFITDIEMKPLPIARVTIKCGDIIFTGFSDEHGYYLIDNIPIVDCYWNVSAYKYGYKIEFIELPINENTIHDFILTKRNIIYVDDDGTADYTRIQDAIDNANEGGTVFVYSGFYNEKITIDKSIALIGENKFDTIIESDDDKKAIDANRDNISISGFTIQNSLCGIEIQKSNFITITNNILKDNIYFGIHLQISSNNTIKNNIVDSNGQVGIGLSSSLNNIINNNTISKNSVEGIHLYWSKYNNINNNSFIKNGHGIALWEDSKFNVISHNNFSNNYNSGIASGSPYNEIKSNLIYGDHDGIRIYSKAKYNLIVGNNIISGLSHYSIGIRLIGCYNTLENNNIDNFYEGILMDLSNNNIISGNYINNCYRGIMFESSENNYITNNNVFRNYCGLQIYPSSHNNTILRNNIFKNDIALDFWNSSFNRISQNSLIDNLIGIDIHISHNNIIHENEISGLSCISIGIMLSGVDNTSITRNNIITNSIGLSTAICYDNQISENNFIKNVIHSVDGWVEKEFHLTSNIWNHNYWNNWRISKPKPILCVVEYLPFSSPNFPIFLPYLKYDENPAKEPYDIEL